MVKAEGTPGVKCVLPEPWAFSKPWWEDDWLGDKGLLEKLSCGRKAGRRSLRPSPPRSRSPTLDSCYFSGQRPWAMWSWPNSRRKRWARHVERRESQRETIKRLKPLPGVKARTRNPWERRAVCGQNPCASRPRRFVPGVALTDCGCGSESGPWLRGSEAGGITPPPLAAPE